MKRASVNPDPNTLCNAIDLLDEAYAISVFITSVGKRITPDTDDILSKEERLGFHLVMCDMTDRIKKASSIVDEYREGASHE
jgi:hypothetical protein